MAGEEGELPFGDVEGDVLERQAALGEGLEDIREFDHLVPRQGLGEVRDEVIGILQSQGKSQKSVRYASLGALFRRETRVGGEAGLRNQRFHTAETRRMRRDRQRLQEPLVGPPAALQLDAEHAAKTAEGP